MFQCSRISSRLSFICVKEERGAQTVSRESEPLVLFGLDLISLSCTHLVSGLQYAGESLFFFECSVNKGNVEDFFVFVFFWDLKQHKSRTPPGVCLTSDLEADQVKRTLASFFLSHHCSPSGFTSCL